MTSGRLGLITLTGSDTTPPLALQTSPEAACTAAGIDKLVLSFLIQPTFIPEGSLVSVAIQVGGGIKISQGILPGEYACPYELKAFYQ